MLSLRKVMADFWLPNLGFKRSFLSLLNKYQPQFEYWSSLNDIIARNTGNAYQFKAKMSATEFSLS